MCPPSQGWPGTKGPGEATPLPERYLTALDNSFRLAVSIECVLSISAPVMWVGPSWCCVWGLWGSPLREMGLAQGRGGGQTP